MLEIQKTSGTVKEIVSDVNGNSLFAWVEIQIGPSMAIRCMIVNVPESCAFCEGAIITLENIQVNDDCNQAIGEVSKETLVACEGWPSRNKYQKHEQHTSKHPHPTMKVVVRHGELVA